MGRRWSVLTRRLTAVVLAGTPAILLAPDDPVPTVPPVPSYELGRIAFHEETFGGNGRTCATCHEPRGGFTLSPAIARARYAADPDHPLFHPKDSDDGDGRSYGRLLDHGLIRVTLPLHPGVVDLDDPSRRTLDVWRGVPTIVNVKLTAPYQYDGRIPTLAQQAARAIRDHMGPTREPTPDEIAGLVEFQTQTFAPQAIRTTRTYDPAFPREPGFTLRISSPAAVRGQAVFERECARCHDGETKHRPRNSHDPAITSVFVSEANRLGLPVHRLEFRDRSGQPVVVETPDPGLAATTGILETANAFEVPQLRGIKNTAPYFHDNSAATLDDVIDHYLERMPGMEISGDEKEDLLAFLDAL